MAFSAPFTDDQLHAIWLGKLRNLQLAWDESMQDKQEIEALPSKAIIELTQNCNFRCIMCPQSWEERFKKYRSEYNMSLELFGRVAEQLFPAATLIDLRGFGETTILPHWPEIVDCLENFPFIEWHLVTNLSLPRDAVWEQMIALGFTLGFSCDGASADVFEGIRVRSRFDRIVHNLGLIRDSIRRHNRGLIYFISTIQKRNVHEMRALVELAHRFDVHEVQFKIVQPGQHHEGLDGLDPEQVTRYSREAVDAAIDLGMRVTFNDWAFTRGLDPERVAMAGKYRKRRTEHPLPRSLDPDAFDRLRAKDLFRNIASSHRVSIHQRCFKPYSYIYVNYLGEVGTCNHMMYPEMLVMGDLNSQSLTEIWNSPKYLGFRRELSVAQPRDHRCQWCFKHRLED
jgi:radical SAM protein with 4Fe4S-binding SPASM domain